jgi:hypothetical protein
MDEKEVECGASSSSWSPAASCLLVVGTLWGWRRGRACVAFSCAWCSVHQMAPLRQWGGRWAAVCAGLCWLCGWECRRCGFGLCGKGATQTRRLAFTHRLPPHRVWQTCFPLHSVPTNANSSPPPSTSTRPTDFSVAKQFDATKRLAITIVPQHSAASHTPTALNCLFCAFLLVLSRAFSSSCIILHA